MCRGSNYDEDLAGYRTEIAARTGLDFPKFCKDAVHTAPLLAILETPGPGAVATVHCCLDNPDPTARRTREVLESVGLRSDQIVFWNLFAAFNVDMTEQHRFRKWACEVQKLVGLMPNLRAVIAFGNVAWLGMRHLKLRQGITLIWSPHPSNLGLIGTYARKDLESAWRRAKEMLN